MIVIEINHMAMIITARRDTIITMPIIGQADIDLTGPTAQTMTIEVGVIIHPPIIAGMKAKVEAQVDILDHPGMIE